MYSKNEFIKIASDLIRFQSIKKENEIQKNIVKYVRNFFEKENVFIKEFKKNGTYSIVITLKKEKNPFLLLNGHLDVVPAKTNDFIPKVKNNRLYGRGSGDMKGGVAVMMMLLRDMSKLSQKPSVGLMLTTDEEIGGENGTGFLVKKKKYNPKFVIIPDGGKNLKEIIIAQKGVLHLKIKAYGKSAHGSRPFLGKNAIETLFDYYEKIQKIIPPTKRDEWKNTVNLGRIRGGESTNSVPDYAEMFLDIRFTKTKDKKRILKNIEKITKGNLEIIAEGEPFLQSEKQHLIKKYINVATKEMKKPIKFNKVEGASDARFFSSEDIPTVITKINCKNIHSDNEWLDLIEVEKFYKIINELVKVLNI